MNDLNQILENGDKVFSGLPYLYRSKGLPSEIYEVRMTSRIDGKFLNLAISDAVLRYPYFSVKFEERGGDFYAVENDYPLTAKNTKAFIALGGPENNFHLMGVSFWENILRLSFHHGLTDGRGAKAFLETIINYYTDYLTCKGAFYSELKKQHEESIKELSAEEYADPCEKKYEISQKNEKIKGLNTKGFKLPEIKEKTAHRRYELKFSQENFMEQCKKIGASPIILLSIMVSRAVKEACTESNKPIVSNFPMDARNVLGCEKTFKNCVKSMTLPYGKKEESLTDHELAAFYKNLLNAQKKREYVAKEFNMIRMLINAVSHFHSVTARKILLGFMENLSLNTYLISYVGQFNMPKEVVNEVHLYSSCSSGLTLNMTCQSENFIIDLVQDFESKKYLEAIKTQFEKAKIDVQISEEIFFETPYDELSNVAEVGRTPNSGHALSRSSFPCYNSIEIRKRRANENKAAKNPNRYFDDNSFHYIDGWHCHVPG